MQLKFADTTVSGIDNVAVVRSTNVELSSSPPAGSPIIAHNDDDDDADDLSLLAHRPSTTDATALMTAAAGAGGGTPAGGELFEAVVAVVVPVLFGLIAVVGFVGNLLVIVVMSASNRKRRRASTTNVLLIGLAVADLVFIVVCVPFTAVSYALIVWPFGTTWCKVCLSATSPRLSLPVLCQRLGFGQNSNCKPRYHETLFFSGSLVRVFKCEL